MEALVPILQLMQTGILIYTPLIVSLTLYDLIAVGVASYMGRNHGHISSFSAWGGFGRDMHTNHGHIYRSMNVL